jgi:uncharacterized phage protein gp47/JayE
MYEKTVDELYAQMVADHENLAGQAPGLLHRIKYSVLAMSFWGVYKAIAWAVRQIFPSRADELFVRQHASDLGIQSVASKTTDELRDEIRVRIQEPPQGGNAADWPRWAREVSVQHTTNGVVWSEAVRDALAYEHHRGSGTINVVITADFSDAPEWVSGVVYSTGEIVTYDSVPYIAVKSTTFSNRAPGTYNQWTAIEQEPTDALVSAVDAYLDGKRPLGIWDYEVYAAQKLPQNVDVTVTGDSADTAAITAHVQAHMKSLGVGKTLYPSQLIALAIDAGAESAEVTTPAAAVVCTSGPTTYERVWPGTITVS